jgi:hypothetical protein
VQVSARVVSQLEHTVPLGAHDVTERARQTSPSQQPVGQLAAVHRHWPPMHSWSEPQPASSVPHTHSPPTQRFALGPHVRHTSPLMPQLVADTP